MLINRLKMVYVLIISWFLVLPVVALLSLIVGLASFSNPWECFLELSEEINLADVWDVDKIKKYWNKGI